MNLIQNNLHCTWPEKGSIKAPKAQKAQAKQRREKIKLTLL
jgi:hypothetical protein